MSPLPTLQSQEPVRDRILSAARSVFLDGPPEQATMDAVAQRAGMSKKTIYREFKSQLELLGALLGENVPKLSEFPLPAREEEIEIDLCALLTRLVTHLTSPRSMALVRLIVSEIRRYPSLLEKGERRSYPVDVIARFLSAPVMRNRYVIADPHEGASMLLGMVTQDTAFKLMISGCAVLEPHVVERRARMAAQIFLRGVERRG
jgi:AcrR family transcriptional regulator